MVAYPLGLGMAILTQNGRHRKTEVGFAGVTGFVQAIPDFVLATALVALFGVTFQLLPVATETGPSSYVLPVLSLTLGSVAVLSRVIRLEGLRVLGEDYIRTARSKRLPARIVYVRHALPNMLTASLTISGLFLAGLVAGTVLVENVFAWPGIGSTVVSSVIARDYPVALALSLLLGAITLIINLVVDVLLAIVDPRSVIREQLGDEVRPADRAMLLATASGRVGARRPGDARCSSPSSPRSIWGDAAERIDTAAMLQGPTGEHPAGTDGLGRDVLARVLVATRPSLWYALLATALASMLGITLGVLPSVMGRRVRPGRHRCWSTCWSPSRADPGPVRRRRVRRRRRPGRSSPSASPGRRPSPGSPTPSPRRWPAPTTSPPPACSASRESACSPGTSCRTSPSRSCST